MQRYARFKSATYPEGCLATLIDDNNMEVMEGNLLEGKLQSTGTTVKVQDITQWLPPVEPSNIIAIGANYVDHCKECDNMAPPENPLVFTKTTNSLIAHDDPIVLPALHPNEVDYEAELAVIIGKTTSYVSESEAMNAVFGYTCANDVSARDVQLRIDSQWARGKSFDSFCPLGPWITTGIENVEDLHIRLLLNGEVMQDQPVSDMIFSIPKIIAHLSAGITLYPGTVILTGTPAGVGMARTPQRYLQPGDSVEVVIDQVGTLRNRVQSLSRP